jgi:3-hydroxyacyl-CoA dehydrogenase/enoyl-CoA hydratase/3-hydroxybutyryl-CoA epimerase
MDLNTLATIRAEAGDDPAKGLFDFTMNGHRILRKLERAGMDPKTNKGGKPVACAITGTCAGIGTEIALACHRRFMADNPKAKIGLPEILVGIFPGAAARRAIPAWWARWPPPRAAGGQAARPQEGQDGATDR